MRRTMAARNSGVWPESQAAAPSQSQAQRTYWRKRASEKGGGRSGLFAPSTRCEYSWRGVRSRASSEPGTFDARRSSALGASTWISRSPNQPAK